MVPSTRRATRRLTVDGVERDVEVLDRARVGAGEHLRGPAVVTGLDSTVWVAPWQACAVDDLGALHLTEAPQGTASPVGGAP